MANNKDSVAFSRVFKDARMKQSTTDAISTSLSENKPNIKYEKRPVNSEFTKHISAGYDKAKAKAEKRSANKKAEMERIELELKAKELGVSVEVLKKYPNLKRIEK